MAKKISLLLTAIISSAITIGMCMVYRDYAVNGFVPSRLELEFLNELKKENNFKGDLIMSVGPYHAFRVFLLGDNYLPTEIDIAMSLSSYSLSSGGAYYMTFDYEFYKRLTVEQRKFIIAHEFWHVRRLTETGIKVRDLPFQQAVQEELRADTMGSRYVKSETIIQFLNIYEENKDVRDARIANIRKISLS